MHTQRLIRIFTTTVALAAPACGSSDGDDPGADNVQDRQALLESVTDNVILPAYVRLADSTAALATATQAYSDVVGTPDADQAREAAELAFLEAYEDMQYAEVLQIGPYGPPSKFEGGQNIRDDVYSWPVVNACRIDQELVDGDYEDSAFFDQALVNVFGFDALEYLLMFREENNSCATQISINADGTWAQLGAQEVERRRAAYAARVAGHIASRAQALRDAWTNGFADELRNAGRGSSVYATSQQAVDAIFASMFYVEKSVKDRKLAGPLGISPDCSAETCPELLESQYATASVAALTQNLQAFTDLYYGGPNAGPNDFGFDDLLRFSNAGDLASEMEQALSLAVNRAPLVVEPMSDNLATEPPLALYQAVQGVTDILKNQFVSVLALRVPNEGAADND